MTIAEIKTALWNNYVKYSRRYQAYPGRPGNNYVRDCIRIQFDEWFDDNYKTKRARLVLTEVNQSV